MNLKPPATLPESNVALDEVLQTIQDQLATTISWLGSNSLGRVKPQTVKGKLEPWIRRGQTSEYYRAYPNDTLPAFSCLYAHDDEKYDGELITRTLSVIVWLNYKKASINSLELAKLNVRQQLRELYCVLAVSGSKDQTVSGPAAIYPGFDVSGLEERYQTHPFAAFRMECIVHWHDLCY
ncbi:hypothetical protein [Spirosoma sordidisoli]|uniref:DUF1834 family protein n=1 Tax=Spirosoma sordidisoli TaxID=2502893 RepID=A0A4Q2USL1_9BACT|nr:hypothetical protein [Spirosoma sordidisoli]RYC70871.1 hypothetical protein EQG79_01585 [Spirosoma sordidisoli]